jgi:hypothetical protein
VSRPIQDCLAEALRNKEANESYFVLMLEKMPEQQRPMFHIQLLEALFGVIEPDEFKTVCAMICYAMETQRLQGLSSDPRTIH